MDHENNKIVGVKPTKPGYLMISYSNGENEIVDLSHAPTKENVVLESELLIGTSLALCPYCLVFLNDIYKYVYYSRVAKGKVYSYRSHESQEVIQYRLCKECGVSIFDWERKAPVMDIKKLKLENGEEVFARFEPVIMDPKVCPGVRMVAVDSNEFEAHCLCAAKCRDSGVCTPDWRVSNMNSKILVDLVNNPYQTFHV